MSSYEDKVRKFHEAFDIKIDSGFSVWALEQRKALLVEETKELIAEIDAGITEIQKQGEVSKQTKMNLLKEMADVQCALSGTTVMFNLPSAEVFSRVMESHMTKLDENGKPIQREDGKILKGPNYKEPELDDLV